mmetsp:Transcript_7071/g.10514  ORF Transcript_7071/g.10514 Transcript_7071/m.10514 type:complete len:99 (-) Transcript_7071:100-396(-)
MDAFTNIPEHQKGEFLRHLEDQQMKDSLKMYNHLVESCFEKCVMVNWGGSFNSKQLTEGETKCISQCSEKFMKLTQRVGFRFSEYQAIKARESGILKK